MRFELSHDIVARQVFEKASAEAQARRKIEKYIHDRHAMYRERGALLTQDDLDYVRPYLEAIQPDAAELAFIQASERAVRQKRNRVRLTVAGVMAILIAATVCSLIARGEARLQADRALARQVVARANASIDDGNLDVAGLLARESGAESPLLTWHLKTSHIRAYLRGHNEGVNAVAHSRDGALLATGSWDDKIALYAASSDYRLTAMLAGHTNDVLGVAFAPDAATLASASLDSTVILWDVARRAPRMEPLRGHKAPVNAVAFSPDGLLLASSSGDGEVILWNVADGSVLLRWQANSLDTQSIAFSPDGKTLAAVGNDGIALRNVRTMADVWRANPVQSAINAVVFSRDGGRIAAASRSGRVVLLDAARGRPLGEFAQPHVAVASALALSPDGNTLALGSWDGTVVQWDMERAGAFAAPNAAPVARGEQRGPTLIGHTSPVLGISFSPDGATLASASEDGAVILWETSENPLAHASLTGHHGGALSVAFSADSKTLATLASDGAVRLWSAPFEAQEPRTLAGQVQPGPTSAIAISPRGDMLAFGSLQGVGLWDLSSGSPQFAVLRDSVEADSLGDSSNVVYAVAFSPDGAQLASGGASRQVVLWDVATRRGITRMAGHEDTIRHLAFSPLNNLLASASDDGRAVLWELGAQQNDIPLIGSDSPITSLAFSPDGMSLAAGGTNGLLMQWDLAILRWRVLPRPHSAAPISGVAFAPNGLSVATSSEDGTVVVWDIARNQPRGDPLQNHAFSTIHRTYAVAFSPDGRWLAAANDDGSVAVWDVSREHIIDRVCAVVGRNLTPDEWAQHVGTRYSSTCPNIPAAAARGESVPQ